MSDQIRTLLLLALPASGKSELRRLLSSLTPGQLDGLHLGPLVQIDDYPYVEFMRHIDYLMDEVFHYGPIFFQGCERPFRDPRSWLTLIKLINGDYDRLRKPQMIESEAGLGEAVVHRIIEASAEVAADFPDLPSDVLRLLGYHMQEKAVAHYKRVFSQKFAPNSTLVIEFSRGGSHNARMPLNSPAGYAGSLPMLSSDILENACILYVQVTPEQAREKNFARAVPPPGREKDTTTYHGVPLIVMLQDYGCDDFCWLADVPKNSKPCDAKHHSRNIHVETAAEVFTLPTEVFNNLSDLTTPLRADPATWTQDIVQPPLNELHKALDRLYALRPTR